MHSNQERYAGGTWLTSHPNIERISQIISVKTSYDKVERVRGRRAHEFELAGTR
jgi:hypothetical protein